MKTFVLRGLTALAKVQFRKLFTFNGCHNDSGL